MNEPDNLLERLLRCDVEFVVIGGFAAAAHGSRLDTQALAVCCRFTTENLLRLQEAVADLHAVHRMTPRRIPLALTPDACAGLQNLYLDTDLGQLDCLSRVLGVGEFDEVVGNSIELGLGAGSCRVLSLDALIRSKEAMGRPRDREAAAQLKAIRERVGAQ